MRSEHNGGASLAAFLLAVSTVTLLFVSPVEGQVGENCVVTAFPGEPESCPALDDQGDPLLCLSDQCQTCESADIVNPSDCFFGAFVGDEDQIENCLRGCFGLYVCTSNSDCQDDRPTCFIETGIIEGQCILECEVSALPGAAESCPDIPVEEVFAGPQLCGREGAVSICVPCARFEQELGITTAAECELFENVGQTEDVVANCQRQCFGFFVCETTADCPADRPFCLTNGSSGATGECFGFFCATNADCPDALPFCDISSGATEGECVATDPSNACETNADCPDTLPICNAGQCEISIFSPLNGMGGSSA